MGWKATGRTSKLNLIATLGLAAGLATVASTCGGVTDSRESARDKATKATCDRYQSCGLIGSDMGDAYATYDSCSTVWKANWEQRWPVATCASINQANLGVCLNAIAATECTSVLDFLATLGKCEDVDVCNMPSHPDGG
jgi:hypothetical protein